MKSLGRRKRMGESYFCHYIQSPNINSNQVPTKYKVDIPLLILNLTFRPAYNFKFEEYSQKIKGALPVL
jgi:hypothetical protein